MMGNEMIPLIQLRKQTIEYNKLRKQCQNLDKISQEQQLTINTLTSRLDQELKQVACLKEENQRLRNQWENAEAHLKSLNDQKMAEVLELNHQNKSLRESLSQQQEFNHTIQQQYLESMQSNNESIKENMKLKAIVRQMRHDIEGIAAPTGQSDSKYTRLLEEKLEFAQEAMDAIMKERLDLLNMCNDLRAKLPMQVETKHKSCQTISVLQSQPNIHIKAHALVKQKPLSKPKIRNYALE